MKKGFKKVIAVFLALTLVCTMAMSVSAFSTQEGKITPETNFFSTVENELVFEMDGSFTGFYNDEPAPLELWVYDWETEEYAYVCEVNITDSVFQSYCSNEEHWALDEPCDDADISEIYVDLGNVDINYADSYKLVVPSDLFVTADGITNNAFEIEFEGFEFDWDYEPTMLERVIFWFMELPYYVAYLFQPVLFIIEIIGMLTGISIPVSPIF